MLQNLKILKKQNMLLFSLKRIDIINYKDKNKKLLQVPISKNIETALVVTLEFMDSLKEVLIYLSPIKFQLSRENL